MRKRSLEVLLCGLALVGVLSFPSPPSPSSTRCALWSSMGGFGSKEKGSKKLGNQQKGFQSRAPPSVQQPLPHRSPARPSSGAVKKEAVIAKTNEGVQTRFRELSRHDPALWEALELRKWLVRWEESRAKMSLLDLAALPDGALREADAKAVRLQELQSQHPHITPELMHNTLQIVTWDSAAQTRAERHDSSWESLPPAAEQFMSRLAAEALCSVGGGGGERRGGGCRVLDVGCGDGLLLRWLRRQQQQEELSYVGVDISPEMVRTACERYGVVVPPVSARGGGGVGSPTFLAQDFMTLTSEQVGGPFEAIVFNEVLHYMLDQRAALAHACSLLRQPSPMGATTHHHGEGEDSRRQALPPPPARIILSHPKGSLSVRKQKAITSSVLVPSLMPSSVSELQALVEGLPLRVVLPAPSPEHHEQQHQEEAGGGGGGGGGSLHSQYLAVLEVVSQQQPPLPQHQQG